jgi:site-specific DNA-methyltransferase (adenine-specific)
MTLTWEVYTEDSVAGITKRIPPGSVDVIVTSPPYNIGKSYSSYDDSRNDSDYLKWMRTVSSAARTALSDQGSFFLNLGSKPSRPSWPFEVLECFRNDFALQNTILWVKSIVIDGDDEGDLVIRGHYKPVNSQRFLSGMSEYVFHLTKNGDVPLQRLGVGTPYKDKSNVRRWGDGASDLRDRGNVWFIPYGTRWGPDFHPCTFPPKLPKMCILLHGLSRTKLVMDPFVGTGSTGRACVELDVGFVGFDVDPHYADLARTAIQETRDEVAESGTPSAHQVPGRSDA